MLPFEFTIAGPPVSQQAHRRSSRKAMWKIAVTTAASAALSPESAPVEQDICVEITHFFAGAPADVDNIAKPILDSMKGLVFKDDARVTDLVCRRRAIIGPFAANPTSSTLAAAIGVGKEFVHVRVTASPESGELRFL
jgi:hypothetical protein